MRVLHINAGNMYGGVETFLTTLAREAHAAPEMNPEFAVCFEGRFSAGLASLGRAPHVLGQARLSRPHTVMRARQALGHLLRCESFDVIVCHQPWACVVFAAVIREAGLPVVLWVHMASPGRHWLERLCSLTCPDLAICNSRFTAASAATWLPRTPIEYLHCPVALPPAGSATTRDSVRQSLQTSSGDVVVVHVGRMEAFKGQRLLLTTLSTLRDLPRWTCWIVGGAQRPAERDYIRGLQALARDCGISERVRFTGERTDIHDVLSAADIYCQPNTKAEGFGLTFVEAMHAGLPVVTSGIGGACEIVDGSCGMLTQPGDGAAVASALRRLIIDEGLRATLGAQARRRPEQLCNVSRQMRRVQAVLANRAMVPSDAAGVVEAGVR